jgi:hypothetical protein
MSHELISSVDQLPVAGLKGLWEDPCITLERDLEARAQGGSPGSESYFAPSGVLGLLGGPESTPGSC